MVTILIKMGHHYIPQYYLRGFCPDFGQTIWVYDKKKARKFSTQIKNIANICGLYTQGLEKYLSDDIENPANRVLEKIHDRAQLTTTDKLAFSKYISVMWKRVPSGMSRLKKLTPGIAEDLRENFHREFNEIVADNPSNSALIQRRKVEIDEILDRYSKEPPQGIWHSVIPADRTPRMVTTIAKMTWRFLTFDEKPAFFTGDNPVFFFSDTGIGRIDSELSFPISSNVTLWATWRLDLKEGYYPTTEAIVKEINRRTASITTRFIFHARGENWILPFLAKETWHPTRIQ